MTTVSGAHLVGSVPLPDADAVFGAAADALGAELHAIPDGETGERYYWLQFQQFRFERTPGLARVGDTALPLREFDRRLFRLDGSVAPDDLRFADLGYADAAIASYARFRALREAGRIAPGVRFQVSLPTPVAVAGVFFVPEDRAAIEPVYERALLAELARILAAVPHEDLAVQWDHAVEFIYLEHADLGFGPQHPWWDDELGGVVERARRLLAAVPADAAVGLHLCYGDVEQQHFVQPADAGVLAGVIRGVTADPPRPIDWIHLPVPIERDDEAYFAPLAGLALPDATHLYLGLVHPEDGLDGALRRVRAASSAVPSFGIATECGLGRDLPEHVAPLLDLHREVLRAAAG